MPGRNHSRDFKLEVVGQINADLHTTAQLCREHSLALSLIHRWRQEGEARGEAALTDPAATDQGGWTQVRPGARDAFWCVALAKVTFSDLEPLRDRPGTPPQVSQLPGEMLRANLELGKILAQVTLERGTDIAQAFAAFVAGWGGEVEVIGPPALRASVAEAHHRAASVCAG